MLILRQLYCLFFAVLIAIFSTLPAFSLPSDWQQGVYFSAYQHASAQAPNLASTARAPPLAVQKVTIASARVHGNGDMRALNGARSTRGMYALVRSSIAPNSVGGSTRIVPGGGLQAHEAAGGHLIQRHVGQTDADLIARLNA